MSAMALTMAASCAVPTIDSIPQAPLEECVYKGDNTEFSVWAPTAEAAQVKLYHSASDTQISQTVDCLMNQLFNLIIFDRSDCCKYLKWERDSGIIQLL